MGRARKHTVKNTWRYKAKNGRFRYSHLVEYPRYDLYPMTDELVNVAKTISGNKSLKIETAPLNILLPIQSELTRTLTEAVFKSRKMSYKWGLVFKDNGNITGALGRKGKNSNGRAFVLPKTEKRRKQNETPPKRPRTSHFKDRYGRPKSKGKFAYPNQRNRALNDSGATWKNISRSHSGKTGTIKYNNIPQGLLDKVPGVNNYPWKLHLEYFSVVYEIVEQSFKRKQKLK